MKAGPSAHARVLELRATVSLARLWEGQRQASKARRVLTRIYSDFAEGFGDADLSDARVLLDELKSTKLGRFPQLAHHRRVKPS